MGSESLIGKIWGIYFVSECERATGQVIVLSGQVVLSAATGKCFLVFFLVLVVLFVETGSSRTLLMMYGDRARYNTRTNIRLCLVSRFR